jgi:Domain of unknown function (DUF4365)
MVNRPLQHRIAAMAVAKVSEVWTSIGAAVEEVKQDYGEDLLVQTSLNGKMDAARIWVQVKGTQSAIKMDRPNGKVEIKVRADLALRWARTADLLVLALWDVSKNIGWYSIPHLSALHSELAEKERQKISLPVYSEDLFNMESAEAVAWRGRLEHLSKFVRNFRMMQKEQDEIDPGPGRNLWAEQAIVAAVADTMLDLKMINRDHQDKLRLVVNPEFWRLFIGAVERNEPESDITITAHIDRMLMLCILSWIDKVAGNGVSHSLIIEIFYFMKALCGLNSLPSR